jgi:hypothetical protein
LLGNVWACSDGLVKDSSAAAVAMASFMGASKETGKDTGMDGRPSCNIAQQSRVVAT